MQNGEGEIRIITEQNSVEWEVQKYCWKLYQDEEKIIYMEKSLEKRGKKHKSLEVIILATLLQLTSV